MEVLRWGYRIPFHVGPTLSKDPIPYPSYSPSSIRGKTLDAEVLSRREGSGGACSSSLSRVLQPVVYGDEGLRILEAGHRPFATESEGAQDFLQDGDSSVCSSLGSAGRLDGFSRLEGYLLAGSDSSRQPQVSQVCCLWLSVPVQGAVLWSLHGSSGFYQSHGNGFDLSASCGHSHPSLPGRLVDPGFVMCSGPSGAGCGAPFVSLTIVVIWEKSHWELSQRMIYLGVLLDSVSFRASPAQKRIETLLSIGDELFSCVEQPVSS